MPSKYTPKLKESKNVNILQKKKERKKRKEKELSAKLDLQSHFLKYMNLKVLQC